MRLKNPRLPKNVDGYGESNGKIDTCFHAMIMADRLRLQINAGDVLYSRDVKSIRKLAKFLSQAADYFAANRLRGIGGRESGQAKAGA